MEIKRSIALDGNLAPRVWNTLSAVPENIFHHDLHGLRHPRSTYTQSINEIFCLADEVLNSLGETKNSFHWESKTDSYPKLIKAYQEWLYKLHSHFDVCFSILRSLCPKSNDKKKFHTDFLKDVNFPGWESFSQSVYDYKNNRLGVIVNSMKHRSTRLYGFYFHSISEFRPGYCLWDIRKDGMLGPSEKLHKDGNSGFSFSRDMMLHIWWLYATGERLAKTIEAAVEVLHQKKLPYVSAPFIGYELGKTMQRIGEIKPEFFPDEISEPYPRIICRKDLQSICLEFPSTVRGHKIRGNIRISGFLSVDAEHRSMKLPYWTGA